MAKLGWAGLKLIQGWTLKDFEKDFMKNQKHREKRKFDLRNFGNFSLDNFLFYIVFFHHQQQSSTTIINNNHQQQSSSSIIIIYLFLFCLCFVSVLSLFFATDKEKTLSMFKYSGQNKPWLKLRSA